MDRMEADVLILGSGIAGLSAAIRLGPPLRVLVVTKGEMFSTNTDLAQGGIAAAIQEEDSPFEHFQDSMSAGDHLCREAALKYMVDQGRECVRELMEWGANFDREGGRLLFTREGAHRIRRILHAHGDATGHEIQQTLVRRARSLPHIQVQEQTACLGLLVADGACRGAHCCHIPSGQPLEVAARATVVATGGAGQLYSHTTNSATATGDGFAMALHAGAVLEDMEFVQFHPTSLQMPGQPNFLLSEAMRGEGGLLRNARGERFMPEYHPMAELAPRDVVSRAIRREMDETGADHVFLDMTHFKEDFLQGRFPTLYSRCLALGLNMSRDLLPVAPAAHFIMGGIKTDLDGGTNLPGLFACGEAACTGVHGANRLASNSLLEGLVFGRRTGLHLRDHPGALLPLPYAPPGTPPVPIPAGGSAAGEAIREEFRNTMWADVGIIRSDESLGRAIGRMQEWLDRLAGDPTLPARETAGMVLVGLGIATAAQQRQGSRGGHFRADFPERGPYGNRHVDLRLDPAGRPEAFWTE
jgi:L-aspartate oxidase